MNSVLPDNEKRHETAEETRADVRADLDVLREELTETFDIFEGRILSLKRQTPNWSSLEPEGIQALFALPIEGDLEEARLGPRAVAVAAARLESFVEEWLADEPPDKTPDADELHRFSDDAHAFVETLQVIGSAARERTGYAHERLDEWRSSSLAQLNELRESDIEAIEKRIEEGELESGHDARAERATIWEDQRQRAAELTDYVAAVHDLLEEGREQTLHGLSNLNAIFERACDELESVHPELGDYRPLDADTASELDNDLGDTVVAPTDLLDDAVGASAGPDDVSDPAPSDPEDTVAESGTPTEVEESEHRPESADSPPDDSEPPSDTDHLVRTDASSASSRPFLRTPPPESDREQPSNARSDRRTPTRTEGDGSREELPRRHDSSFINPDSRDREDSDTGHGLGLESSSELQEDSSSEDERSSSDTSSSLQIQVDQLADSRKENSRESRDTSPVGERFLIGGDDAPSDPSETDTVDESESLGESEPLHPEADDPTPSKPDDQTPLIDSPVAGRCARFRSEWRRVPLTTISVALAIPALLISAVTVLGLAYAAGIPGLPNPFFAWPWLESASAVALLWLAAAPPLLGWRVEWRGWRCRIIQHVELRQEGRLRLDTEGLMIHDNSLPWRDLDSVEQFRFETSSGKRGWLMVIRPAKDEKLTLIAPANSNDAWRDAEIDTRTPPTDAWQTDADTFHQVARHLVAANQP